MNEDILVSAIILPMIGSFVVVLLGRTPYRVKALFSFGIAAATFVLLLIVAATVSFDQILQIRSDMLAEFGISLILNADALATFFGVIVSFFGMVAILYSYGDMMHEEGATRYYALMLLFMSSMIGLVMAGNFLVLYAFWELVGLCSFSLIGFYREKVEASKASFQAFSITRTLGVCLLIGAVILFRITGSFDIPVVFQRVQTSAPASIVFVVLALFLLAAMAKSVQVPFHVWLPNATVAPSAVTSYLHAAAMVKAGVYLVARTYDMIAPSIIITRYHSLSLIVGEEAYTLTIAIIGTITLVMCNAAAWMQTDVKKVLAYSTCGQIGYMFLGLGIGTGLGVTGALFHLLNHAMFKGLLFLGAGSLIYATGTKNLNRMGGLARRMPLTAAAMMIGSLSIVGIPPFNGFASKLIIYEAALGRGIQTVGFTGFIYAICCALALFASALTFAAYFKVMNSAFFGRLPQKFKDVKDPPLSMKIPMVILACLCVVFGVYPQGILRVLVNPAVSAVTGESIITLNDSISSFGFQTGIGFYQATALTIMILGSISFGALLYKASSKTLLTQSPSDKYGIFLGGESATPYIDVEQTRVGTSAFTFAARSTFGEPHSARWISRTEESMYELALWIQRLSDRFSSTILDAKWFVLTAVIVFGSGSINPSYPGMLMMIVGTLMALSQKDLKRLLVCGLVAQIGLIAADIGYGITDVSHLALLILNFSCFAVLLTLSSREVMRKMGTSSMAQLKGLSSKMPIAAVAFLVGGMSMSGVPPFGGWVDEVFFIRSGIENIRFEFLVIQIAVSLLTFLYMLRAFNQIFGGFNPVLFGEISERYHELKGTAAAKSLVLIVLMILAVCIGVAPQLFVLFINRMGNVAFP